MKRFAMVCAMLGAVSFSGMIQAGLRYGAVVGVDTVSAYSSVEYTDVFQGQEWAVVRVDGDGDTDLDLYIYDVHGNLIASDTDYSDSCYVEFFSRRTSEFTIVVKNRGRVYNEFVFSVN